MVDTVKGTVLSNLLKDRDAVRAEAVGAKEEPKIGAGRISKYLGTALGIFLSIVLGLGVLYILTLAIGRFTSAPAASGAIAEPPWWTNIPFWLVLPVLGGFAGFILGLSLV
jgi:hypothetical protein